MSIEEGDYIETKARWGKRFVEVINPNKTDEILRFYFNQPEAEKQGRVIEIEFLDWVHPRFGIMPAKVEGDKPLVLRAKLKEKNT